MGRPVSAHRAGLMQPSKRTGSFAGAAGRPCNSSVQFVILTMAGSGRKDKAQHFLDGYRQALPPERTHVLRAVNGFNPTTVIHALKRARLPFWGLSQASRFWGVLGCALSHFYALHFQVEHNYAFQITLEEDVYLRPGFLADFVPRVCARYETLQRGDGVDLLQLSKHTEMRLTVPTADRTQNLPAACPAMSCRLN